MSGFNPYNNDGGNFGDGTGYGNYNSNSGSGGLGSQDNSRPRQNVVQTVTPVTIRELEKATQTSQDAPFEVYGFPLYYVSFIGIVREIDTQNQTSTIYKVEDGSGATSVRQWNDDGDAMDEPPFKTGEYVKIVSTLREFNGKKQLQTQSIRKIEDFNEVSYHFLSAIKAYVTHTQDPKAESSAGGSGLFVDNGSQGSAVQNTGATNANLPMTEKLFNFIKENGKSMAEGVPTQLMAQEFNMSTDQVANELVSLVDEGRIFATDDESLYLCV